MMMVKDRGGVLPEFSHGQALRLAGPAADEARGEGVHLASPGELGGMERGQETPRDAAGNRVSDPEDP